MNPDTLNSALIGEVRDAIAFLNIVVSNNPSKSLDEISERTDVKEAVGVIFDWLGNVTALTDSFPIEMAKDRKAVAKTIATMRGEVRGKVWADPKKSNLLFVRMVWMMDWIIMVWEFLKAFQAKRYQYKTWISRLSETTCKYCRAMHGITIPIGNSFIVHAKKAGWKRAYGELLTPNLHVNCRCTLVYH